MPRVYCPCGARYKVAESSLGKKAKCQKCGEAFELKLPDDAGPIPIAPADIFDEGHAAAPNEGPPAPVVAGSGGASITALPPTGGSALADHITGESHPMGARQYFHDLLMTMVFPRKAQSLVSFVFMWFILVLGMFGLHVPLFGIVLYLIASGLYAAYRLSVIESAAAGEDEVPVLSFEGGMAAGVVVPLLKWLGTWLVVLCPAFVLMAITAAASLSTLLGGVTGLIAAPGLGLSLLALVLAGIFLWPMVVLCVTLGGFESLVRVDLILPTLFKTLPLYVLTVGIVFGTQYADYFWRTADWGRTTSAQHGSAASNGAPDDNGDGTNAVPPTLSGQTTRTKRSPRAPIGVGIGPRTSLASIVIGAGVTLYLEIIAMRAIGLYYFHFKRRFAWDWG